VSKRVSIENQVELDKLSAGTVSHLCAVEMGKDQKLNEKYREYLFSHYAEVASLNTPAFRAIEHPRHG
jgi:hypothetical protein